MYFASKSHGEKIFHHSQSDARGKTIVDYMNYIIRHDQWREQIKNEYRTLPKTTKRQRDYYKSQKKKARRNAIHNVYNLIEKIRVEKKFERIHPFQDGNGRVGRLIMFKEWKNEKRLSERYVFNSTRQI